MTQSQTNMSVIPEDHIPADTILRDGRLWRDMSWVEQNAAVWKHHYLRKLLPISLRRKRIMALWEMRRPRPWVKVR